MEKVTLKTSRLTLRAPLLADVVAITIACQDAELQRRVPIPLPYTRQSAVDYVETFSNTGWEAGRTCTWALDHDGAFAGVIGIDLLGDSRGELGYWLSAEWRGHGLLTEAALRIIDFAFAPTPDALGLERLGWRAFAGNIASARVAQRVGFRFEGVSRRAGVGRQGLEDEWLASLLPSDGRSPTTWSIPEQT
ncbi:acetyltransferase [Frondihabitans sp. PAMC 28766]|uniref:GNAT family N-acetyltransferase n=1 Tax=Frondihabitans sp. PAMC 28766 TaxID=1795630 RepID=UPI00078E4226|nr:GNAT family protein [Frondihabitans sp. PAMC 28766]AMM19750.1 acetyltransferase [Frondihabitans sp. PAMC 28766]